MQRHKVVPASYLLLENDNKYLMLRRFNTGYRDGEYSLVSGHGDEGESPRQTIIREAREEAGITVSIDNLELVHIVSRKAKDFERIDFFWHCLKWEGQVANIEPHKCDDLSWFSRGNLPENLVPELQAALAGIAVGDLYSELNWI